MQFSELPLHVQISINAVGGPDTDQGQEMAKILCAREGLTGVPMIEHATQQVEKVETTAHGSSVVVAAPNPEEDPVLAILSAAAEVA